MTTTIAWLAFTSASQVFRQARGDCRTDMKITRVFVLLFACLLPWQAVRADVSAVQADQLAAEMAEMPCHSMGADCCDDGCQLMASCVAGAVMLPASVLKVSLPLQEEDRLPLRVQSLASAIPENPLRPPISLVV